MANAVCSAALSVRSRTPRDEDAADNRVPRAVLEGESFICLAEDVGAAAVHTVRVAHDRVSDCDDRLDSEYGFYHFWSQVGHETLLGRPVKPFEPDVRRR
jgi:hypothetical protein